MKYSRLIIFYAFCLIFMPAASVQLDSLSYSLGYMASAELLSGDTGLFTSDADIKGYISGLEENVPSGSVVDDSCYIKNYSIGVMQGGYIVNRLAQTSVEWETAARCIVWGVRKVVDKSVSLPADTIGLMKRLTVLADSEALQMLSADDRCDRYIEYGIFTGLHPELQQLIDENGGSGIKADNIHFARGVIDIIESMIPSSAYDLGRSTGKLLIINSLVFPSFTIDDYIKGVKAALRLTDPLLSQQDMESVVEMVFGKREAANNDREEKKIKSGNKEYVSGDACKVKWRVTVKPVADPSDCPMGLKNDYDRAIEQVMDRFGIKEMIQFRFSGFMKFFREPAVERGELMKLIKSLNKKMKQGYKLFCFRSLSGEWTIGLASEKDGFDAQVGEVVVDIYNEWQPVVGLSFVFSCKVEQWAEFTKSNIGRVVVMEINDDAVMAPLINSEITSGACSITASSVEELERLLNL